MHEVRTRNHRISEFYLNGFAKDLRNQLFYFDKNDNTLKGPLSTKKLTREKNAFTIVLPDGTLDDSLEKEFDKIENDAAQILNDIYNDKSNLNSEQISVLKLLIASFSTRSKEFSDKIKTVPHILMQKQEELLEKAKNDFSHFEDAEIMAEQVLKEMQQEYFQDKNYEVKAIVRQTKYIFDALSQKNWHVVPVAKHFITTDNPIIIKSHPSSNEFLDEEINIPLSKNHILHLEGKDKKFVKHSRPDHTNYKDMNNYWAENAYRYIFSDSKKLITRTLKRINIKDFKDVTK